MKKKLSYKVIMSLVLSAVLFCMPIGAFMANSGNTVDVHAQDMDVLEESTGEDTGETESVLRCPAMICRSLCVSVIANAQRQAAMRNVRSARRIIPFVSM